MDLALLQQSRRQLASIKLISGGAYYYAVSDSGKRFMCYCFNITSHKGAWKIYRRYREFTAIHKKLSTKVPLPRKGSLFFRSTRNHRKRVERRYDGLCSWLTTVFSLLKGPRCVACACMCLSGHGGGGLLCACAHFASLWVFTVHVAVLQWINERWARFLEPPARAAPGFRLYAAARLLDDANTAPSSRRRCSSIGCGPSHRRGCGSRSSRVCRQVRTATRY